jgi:putative SOS response-associated peptidase YedK
MRIKAPFTITAKSSRLFATAVLWSVWDAAHNLRDRFYSKWLSETKIVRRP